ncbi:MAG: hypothetical protein LBG27_10305 [Spirochaetaceae bacterium]|nr:hypothetical protein [Spirochaetaceae bacterium]
MDSRDAGKAIRQGIELGAYPWHEDGGVERLIPAGIRYITVALAVGPACIVVGLLVSTVIP